MNQMKYYQWLAVCALAIFFACGSDETSQYVARIGEREVSLAEFEMRAQKLLRKTYSDLDSLDKTTGAKLLDDIIARELLILEGLERGLDRDSTVAEEIGRTEQKNLIDTLYARQALKKEYIFHREELMRFFKARDYDVEVHSKQIVCASEESAWEALHALQKGESFASLVPKYSQDRIQSRFGSDGDIGWFKMGNMLEGLKEPIRSMEIGETTTKPVKSRLGYHVFQLVGRRPVSLDSVRTWVAKQLRIQEMGKDRARYVQELRRSYDLKAHGEAIEKLLTLPPDQRYWEGGDEPLFTWKGGSFTIHDYLAMHRRGRAKHPASLDNAGMYKAAENLAGQQIMKTEARTLDYDRDPAIIAAIENRRNQLVVEKLFRLEGGDAAREVGDADVRAYYDENTARFTNPEGEVTDFEKVSGGIRQLLRRQAGDRAMDSLIELLREKYRDRIEIRAEALSAALANLRIPTEDEPVSEASEN